MENDNYEIVVRDINGKLLHEGNYPAEAIILVTNNTHPKKFDGWCYSETVFSNLNEEKKSKLLAQLTNLD